MRGRFLNRNGKGGLSHDSPPFGYALGQCAMGPFSFSPPFLGESLFSLLVVDFHIDVIAW
jgi:hypothetical protein